MCEKKKKKKHLHREKLKRNQIGGKYDRAVKVKIMAFHCSN